MFDVFKIYRCKVYSYWFLVYSQRCATITTVLSENIFIKKTLYPSALGNHYPIFYLYGFGSSGHFT